MKFGNISGKIQGKMLKTAEKGIGKIAKRMNLDQQCVATMRYAKLMGTEVVKGNLLADHAFPSDIRNKQKETGWSDEELVEFYWSHPKFIEMWSKLGMDKEEFEIVVAMATAPDNALATSD